MFIIYFAEIPTREVRAEEIMLCSNCKKKTKHRYEEICFHARAMFINVFCKKKRYARICSECNFGVNLTDEEFKKEMNRLVPPKGSPGSPSKVQKFEHSKKKGVTYCNKCGERIFPDIGYCTSCAVRGPGK
jgi:hypothetical protein